MANNLKGYDAFQVLRSVFDVDKNTLRVSIVDGSTGGGGGFEVIINHTDDSIRLGNGTNFFTSTFVGPKIGLDVGIVNEVNIEDIDASKDNIAIRDSNGDELNINSDGSINVNVASVSILEGYNVYNEITTIASNIETTIVSHTAVIGKKTILQKISASGDNIAKYKVKINGNTVDFKRTNFASELNVDFFFDGQSNSGLELAVGDIITVTVIHERGGVGDFNAKILYIEV